VPESLPTFSPLLKVVAGDVYDPQMNSIDFSFYYLSNANLQAANVMILFQSTMWSVPNRYRMHSLPNSELVPFSRFLRHIFTVSEFIPQFDHLPKILKCYKQIEFGQEIYSVYNNSRYGRHSYVLASKWVGNDGNFDIDSGIRPGRIKNIFVYKFIAGDGKVYSLPLAMIEWYKFHSNQNMFGVGLDLCYRDDFVAFGPSSYIPIACIKSKFAPAYGSIDVTPGVHESVLFICPLRSKCFV
jgi:hypothetical protein